MLKQNVMFPSLFVLLRYVPSQSEAMKSRNLVLNSVMPFRSVANFWSSARPDSEDFVPTRPKNDPPSKEPSSSSATASAPSNNDDTIKVRHSDAAVQQTDAMLDANAAQPAAATSAAEEQSDTNTNAVENSTGNASADQQAEAEHARTEGLRFGTAEFDEQFRNLTTLLRRAIAMRVVMDANEAQGSANGESESLSSAGLATLANLDAPPTESETNLDFSAQVAQIEPENAAAIDIHFLLNGVDCGPCMLNVQYDLTKPLFVVIDVYGTTKQLRIIEMHNVPTLRSLCRTQILECLNSLAHVRQLPIPEKLKVFLLKGV